MARAVRKTVRAIRNRWVHLYLRIIIGLLLVSLWLSWRNVWQTAFHSLLVAALLLVDWKEDSIDAFFAKRKALPGTAASDTEFFSDHFLVKTAAAESKWQYDKILALAAPALRRCAPHGQASRPPAAARPHGGSDGMGGRQRDAFFQASVFMPLHTPLLENG